MDKFLTKLKQQAEDNPALALGVGAAVVTSLAKFIDATSAAQGRKALAKQRNANLKRRR